MLVCNFLCDLIVLKWSSFGKFTDAATAKRAAVRICWGEPRVSSVRSLTEILIRPTSQFVWDGGWVWPFVWSTMLSAADSQKIVLGLLNLLKIINITIVNYFSLFFFEKLRIPFLLNEWLTLTVPIQDAERKIKLSFYFRTSLWCLKRFSLRNGGRAVWPRRKT